MKSSSDLHYSNCKEHYVFLPNIDSCVVRVCTMCLPCQIIKMNIQKNRLLIAEFCERKWKIQPVHVLGITLGKLSINELVSSSMWQPTPVLLPGKSLGRRSLVGCSPWVAKSRTGLSNFTFTFHFHALENEMVTDSSVLAWRIPGTGEPGGLLSMGSHRVGHD